MAQIKTTQLGEVQVASHAGAPSDGTAGTGAGILSKGALLVDVTNAKLYINTNTKASPTWTVVGAQT
jgi:hypothetical protein